MAALRLVLASSVDRRKQSAPPACGENQGGAIFEQETSGGMKAGPRMDPGPPDCAYPRTRKAGASDRSLAATDGRIATGRASLLLGKPGTLLCPAPLRIG